MAQLPNGWVSGPSLGHLTQRIKKYSPLTVPGGVILCHLYYTKLSYFSENAFNRHVALSTSKLKKSKNETLRVYKNMGHLPNALSFLYLKK
jgi:hypothetical protein